MMMLRNSIWLAGIALLAAALAWNLKPTPPPQYREVVVHDTIITQSEPDTVVRWRERVVTRIVRPESEATSESGGEGIRDAFCAPDTIIQVDTLAGDTVYVVNRNAGPSTTPIWLLRSVTTQPAWFFGSDQIQLTGPLSTGGLKQATYRVRPGWSAIVHADSLIVRSPRWGILRPIAELFLAGTAGYLIGRIH